MFRRQKSLALGWKWAFSAFDSTIADDYENSHGAWVRGQINSTRWGTGISFTTLTPSPQRRFVTMELFEKPTLTNLMINRMRMALTIYHSAFKPAYLLHFCEKGPGNGMIFANEQQEAFQRAKNLLQSSDVLVHYDPEKELLLWCVTLWYWGSPGPFMEDGSEKPIAYASRTLSLEDRGYGHLDKEALAVVFRFFKFYTDHKPLWGLLNEERDTPPMASSRIQRWSLTLLAYEYEFGLSSGFQHGNADALSRLPFRMPQRSHQFPEILFTYENH